MTEGLYLGAPGTLVSASWFGVLSASSKSPQVSIFVDVLDTVYTLDLGEKKKILETAVTHCHGVFYCESEDGERILVVLELLRPENAFEFSLTTGEAKSYSISPPKKSFLKAQSRDVFLKNYWKSPCVNRHLTATVSTVFFVDEDSTVFRLFSDEDLLKRQRFRPTVVRTPVDVMIIQVSSGEDHSVFLADDGRVFTMGCGSKGELGLGENVFESRDELLQIEALEDLRVVKIVCGSWHSAALTDTDDVYAWGWNKHGQAGPEEEGPILWQPVPLDLQYPCKDLFAFENHTRLKIENDHGSVVESMGTVSRGENKAH